MSHVNMDHILEPMDGPQLSEEHRIVVQRIVEKEQPFFFKGEIGPIGETLSMQRRSESNNGLYQYQKTFENSTEAAENRQKAYFMYYMILFIDTLLIWPKKTLAQWLAWVEKPTVYTFMWDSIQGTTFAKAESEFIRSAYGYETKIKLVQQYLILMSNAALEEPTEADLQVETFPIYHRKTFNGLYFARELHYCLTSTEGLVVELRENVPQISPGFLSNMMANEGIDAEVRQKLARFVRQAVTRQIIGKASVVVLHSNKTLQYKDRLVLQLSSFPVGPLSTLMFYKHLLNQKMLWNFVSRQTLRVLSIMYSSGVISRSVYEDRFLVIAKPQNINGIQQFLILDPCGELLSKTEVNSSWTDQAKMKWSRGRFIEESKKTLQQLSNSLVHFGKSCDVDESEVEALSAVVHKVIHAEMETNMFQVVLECLSSNMDPSVESDLGNQFVQFLIAHSNG